MIKVSKNWHTYSDSSTTIEIYEMQRPEGLGYFLETTNPGGSYSWGGFAGNMFFAGKEMKLPAGYTRTHNLSLNAIFLFSCKNKLYVGSHGSQWLYEIDPDKDTIAEIHANPHEFWSSTFINEIFELYPETDAILYGLSVLKTNYKYQIFGYNSDATKWFTRISISTSDFTVYTESFPNVNQTGAVNTGATRIYSYYRTLEKEDFDPVLEYIQDLADAVEDVQEDVAKLNSEARSKFVSR